MSNCRHGWTNKNDFTSYSNNSCDINIYDLKIVALTGIISS